MAKARMRTINEAAKYIKNSDPETCFTPYALRRAVVEGRIPSVKMGNKYLINLDVLDAWLTGETMEPQQPQASGIRPIPERLQYGR